MLEGKWKLEILCAMHEGPVRLSQLTRLIPSASKKALRASLRALETAQIVVRHDLSDTVLHVEYDFAHDKRDTVCSLLDQLAHWGDMLNEASRTLPQ
jgi:DNA-binding HxlR family transcriptional regulator